ncbi:helix-turn-helix transcriptional regulator, partial [Streptomyces sp. MB09-01]|uniref:helix-turn-helix domain-containing protein n=1 Tax=Streptomyces sp. MB09-01 TaxID=3028666 RepID=UPI0029B68605
MATQEELFDAVDALLEGEPQLPSPAERARLREAAGVTQARLAAALKSTPQTVKNWENGRSEPRPPRLQAYLRLLDGWAERYPAPAAAAPTPAAVPEAFTGTAEQPAESAEPAAASTAAVLDPVVKARVEAAGPSATSRRPVKKGAPLPAVDPRFPHGPLVVLDGDGSAYGVDGIVLDCPATT